MCGKIQNCCFCCGNTWKVSLSIKCISFFPLYWWYTTRCGLYWNITCEDSNLAHSAAIRFCPNLVLGVISFVLWHDFVFTQINQIEIRAKTNCCRWIWANTKSCQNINGGTIKSSSSINKWSHYKWSHDNMLSGVHESRCHGEVRRMLWFWMLRDELATCCGSALCIHNVKPISKMHNKEGTNDASHVAEWSFVSECCSTA